MADAPRLTAAEAALFHAVVAVAVTPHRDRRSDAEALAAIRTLAPLCRTGDPELAALAAAARKLADAAGPDGTPGAGWAPAVLDAGFAASALALTRMRWALKAHLDAAGDAA